MTKGNSEYDMINNEYIEIVDILSCPAGLLRAVCYCHSVVVLDKNCGSKLTANMISKVPYIYVAGTPCKNF